MKITSLEQVAQGIFGKADRRSIQEWVQYWADSAKRNRQLLEAFQKLVLIDFRGKRVLDIGCGTGGMREIIGDRCRLYVGGDYHWHVLQFARSARGGHFMQCSAPALPFKDRSFDYIFAFDVIEHLIGGEPWQVQFLCELRRILRPMGMVFLTTPNFWYPNEGHSKLYFPQYLPSTLADHYIAWRKPSFLREHRSFSEIQLLTPRSMRATLKKSRLIFLHDLPCGLDRSQFLRQFPLRSRLVYLGLGWYLHAEFWGILVHSESRPSLRLKLRKHWYYEQKEPSSVELSEFSQGIDFSQGPLNHQLGPGWYWYEVQQESGLGYRWMKQEARCYLETQVPVKYLCLSGYSPRQNHLDIWLDGIKVGEHEIELGSRFELEYLVPFAETREHIFEVRLRCSTLFVPKSIQDRRQLGVMIFGIRLV